MEGKKETERRKRGNEGNGKKGGNRRKGGKGEVKAETGRKEGNGKRFCNLR